MPDGVRNINIRYDLNEIANLIELCFGSVLDASGRAAIREMRSLSRSGPLLWLISWFSMNSMSWAYGSVYVDSGTIVGNIGAQPLDSQMHNWLIANVAVHPDYRRRGIARKLVNMTLNRIKNQGARRVILQVDDGNVDAINLYQQLGFNTFVIRNLWKGSNKVDFADSSLASHMTLRPALYSDWAFEYKFLQQNSPEGITWTAPLQIEQLRPSFWRDISVVMSGNKEKRWILFDDDTKIGWLYILTGTNNTVQVRWIVSSDYGIDVDHKLFCYALNELTTNKWDVLIEHPDGEINQLMRGKGFKQTRTLQWMELVFFEQEYL